MLPTYFDLHFSNSIKLTSKSTVLGADKRFKYIVAFVDNVAPIYIKIVAN